MAEKAREELAREQKARLEAVREKASSAAALAQRADDMLSSSDAHANLSKRQGDIRAEELLAASRNYLEVSRDYLKQASDRMVELHEHPESAYDCLELRRQFWEKHVEAARADVVTAAKYLEQARRQVEEGIERTMNERENELDREHDAEREEPRERQKNEPEHAREGSQEQADARNMRTGAAAAGALGGIEDWQLENSTPIDSESGNTQAHDELGWEMPDFEIDALATGQELSFDMLR